ncbi:hypothetical protein ACLI09_01820 [Flavobacterium sp. RHBU_24]|uniref:hypothetical protein n=1 Tax=Flavobacterium sp. RHBU_24 TaxID=3391185 RepID=UPI0039856802
MKLITSLFVFSILAGCSTDDPQPATATYKNDFYKKTGNSVNATGNTYAQAGVVYQEMLDAYFLLPDIPGNLQQVIGRAENIAFLNPGFITLDSASPYQPLEASDFTPYLQGGTIEGLLSQGYSNQAREILIAMASELEQMKAQNLPFQDVAAFFKESDGNIASDLSLAASEKNAMLATTAIICNALDNDRKRKRRDRDWEWMTTHYAATANAALESVPQAMIMSFVIDVY